MRRRRKCNFNAGRRAECNSGPDAHTGAQSDRFGRHICVCGIRYANHNVFWNSGAFAVCRSNTAANCDAVDINALAKCFAKRLRFHRPIFRRTNRLNGIHNARD